MAYGPNFQDHLVLKEIYLLPRDRLQRAWNAEVDLVEKFLHYHNIYPQCMLCPNGVGFAEHVPAEKHLRDAAAIWAKVKTPHIRGVYSDPAGIGYYRLIRLYIRSVDHGWSEPGLEKEGALEFAKEYLDPVGSLSCFVHRRRLIQHAVEGALEFAKEYSDPVGSLSCFVHRRQLIQHAVRLALLMMYVVVMASLYLLCLLPLRAKGSLALGPYTISPCNLNMVYGPSTFFGSFRPWGHSTYLIRSCGLHFKTDKRRLGSSLGTKLPLKQGLMFHIPY